MDNYELANGEIIYPLFQIEENGKKYLFYSYKVEDVDEEDIYVGEEVNNELLPVSEEMLPILEQKYQDSLDKIIEEVNKS